MAHAHESKYNLFVYGSLREPNVFKGVCGLSFSFNPDEVGPGVLYAAPAILPGYRRVSPDNVYYYGVAEPDGRIEGFVTYDVPDSAVAEIDRYEGKRYDRETVQVISSEGKVEALAYLADHGTMRRHFGDRFHVNLIHELWLRKRIERFIETNTRPGETSVDADLERRARRELQATTERDLVISHYRARPVSDFFIEREFDRPRPSIFHLYDDPEAKQFIENYLALVVRQVILNQFESKIRERYRYELEHYRGSDRYYNRTLSLLAALRMINANHRVIDLITYDSLSTMPYPDHDLLDYVKYAISAADSCFTWQLPRDILARMSTSFQPGLIPMGAEIELSNLGYRAVPPLSLDVTEFPYNNFKYFRDFKLDVLTWKLGGYIDDHSEAGRPGRSGGFFECAPGRLSSAHELSRPVTADPWILNQLIQEMVRFYQVQPHSLHLSFQVRRHKIGKAGSLPLDFVKCLLAIGGGPIRDESGNLIISRMFNNEIIWERPWGEELMFSRTSKRSWYMAHGELEDRPPAHATTCVQQYKFLRLTPRTNYESIILALKGIQLECNPENYITVEQSRYDPRIRGEFEELKEWSARPRPIEPGVIGDFLDAIRSGLMQEGHNRPAHRLHYIEWAISAIRLQLRMFNRRVTKPR